MIDPPHPTRERDHSWPATTRRVTVTRPRPTRGWIEGRIVTGVVGLRNLIGGVNRNFPHPSCRPCAKAVVQTNGLLGLVSAFGRFWAYQILPNFTNSYQECVAKGVRRGSKRQLTRGFLRPIYVNRVKSGGSCQAVSFSVISCQFSVFSFQSQFFSS